MGHKIPTVPDLQGILEAWLPFKERIGVTSVRKEEDYARVRAILDALLDEFGDDENHPLADELDYLADQIKAYKDEHALAKP